MGKIIQAREEDSGMKGAAASVLFVFSLITGLGGVPVGAILSGVMQGVLKNSSAPVMYGFFLGPIFLGMLLGFFYMRKTIREQDRTKCEFCKGKMHPMSEKDLLFAIPAREEQKYENALHYLAKNMSRIAKMGELGSYQRGCFVCVYQCEHCSKRLIRIKDFLPLRGSCLDRGTYYFDYAEFLNTRGKDDLIY